MAEDNLQRITCPNCTARIGVKPAHEGKRIKCPKCAQPVNVPFQTAPTEESKEPRENTPKRHAPEPNLPPSAPTKPLARQPDTEPEFDDSDEADDSEGQPRPRERMTKNATRTPTGKVWGVAGLVIALLATAGVATIWVKTQQHQDQAAQ